MAAPKPFDSSASEIEFQKLYKLAGLQFSRIALSTGLFAIVLFWLMLFFFEFESQASSARQVLRLLLILILSIAICNLSYRKKQVIQNYDINLGIPVTICALIVGSMGFLPLNSGGFSDNRFIAALILICWLAYGFTRLPVRWLLAICLLSSLLNFLSVVAHGDDHAFAIFIYLSVANFLGWVSAVTVERRERVLFVRQMEIMEERNLAYLSAKKAQASNEARARVLAAVNHDLRQPMASLALYVQQLREQLTGGDLRLQGTADCLEACVTAISSDLDHLADLGSDESWQDFPVGVVDLRTVLERVDRVYSGLARSGGVRLVTRMPEDGSLLALSNESRLWDVLTNLVSNAIKFSDPRRERWVLIRVGKHVDAWKIVVRDNGVGISADEQERVFEEYFRVAGPVRSRSDGQGLGLAIVKRTVDRLDGHRLDFWSAPDKGSRFSLRIPLAAVDATLPLAGVKPLTFVGGGDGSSLESGAQVDTVLLVEDDDAMAEVLSSTLRRWGYVVRRAATGEDAIEQTLQAQDLLSVIISDFRLPGAWDGLRLIERLRTLEGQRTPALVLSGEFRLETLRHDAPDDVRIMSKPPDVAGLRAFLEKACRVDETTDLSLS